MGNNVYEYSSHVNDRRLWLALEASGCFVERYQRGEGWYWRVEIDEEVAEHPRLILAACKLVDLDVQVAKVVIREQIRRHEEEEEERKEMMKKVAFWKTLMDLAKEEAEAKKSGDQKRLAEAEKRHEEYKQICLDADEMSLSCDLKRNKMTWTVF